MSLRRLAHALRESLFTIPLAMVIICVVAALLAPWLDSIYSDTLESWPIVLASTVAGGRAVASAVAGATITVAAIVFSITALSTQMASNQYTPRALAGFFEDRLQQVVIGLVVGTFTYSILILASLSSAIIDGAEATPSISVSIAIFLGVASAIGIVAFINHSLRRMQIDSVVRRISTQALESIQRHLRERDPEEIPQGRPPGGESGSVLAGDWGWVVDILTDQVLESIPPQTTVRVDVRIGEAVSRADRIATVWPDPGDEWGGRRKLQRAIVTAGERSIATDPTFGIRQLVDIALRALSPGVNDPTTAVDVVHHLKTPVREVLTSDPPRRVFSGDDDRRVFLTETPSRSDYVHDAFSEIRLASSDQPAVLTALIEVLQDLGRDLEGEDLEGRESAVVQELDLTVQAARDSGLPAPDLARVLRKYRAEGDEGPTPME